MRLHPWLLFTSAVALIALMAFAAHWSSLPSSTGLLVVGSIRVKDVKVNHNVLQVDVAPNNGFCSIELAGGVHVDWQVDLERIGTAQPADWGHLALAQNVIFRHRRSPTNGQPPHECVGSPQWALDGQYPFLNHRVACAAGANHISLADDPNVGAESPSGPCESVEVAPGDQFRTYVIWEVTDDNRPPTPANPARQHVLARVDWHWAGVGVNSGSKCKSAAFPPNAWDAQSPDAAIDRVLTGAAALTPTPPSTSGAPVFTPLAAPTAWQPCP